MCVTTKAYATGKGYAYNAMCYNSNSFSCSGLHQSIYWENTGEEEYMTHVEANKYDSHEACQADEDYYKENGPTAAPPSGGGGGGNKPAICSGGYVQPMPNGYLQSNVFCEYAYNLICTGGYSPSSAEVKEVCDTYKTWHTHDELKDCKYCK
jgi:hypothetical protein